MSPKRSEKDLSSPPADKKAKVVQAALFPEDDLWKLSWEEDSGERTLRRRMNPESQEKVKFTLYSSWFCPFAQRAWIAAEESGVDYKWVEINPYYVDPKRPGGYTKNAKTMEEKRQDNPDFVSTSPRGLVPALKMIGTDDEDVVLWESMPVAEYIDAVFGGGKLLDRSNPYTVARQQIWCDHCTNRIQKKFYQALVAQDEKVEKACTEQFVEECRAFARAMKSLNDGPFFEGSKFSMVDVCLAPFWHRVLHVGPYYFGLKLPQDIEFHRLQLWWQAVVVRPSVADTIVNIDRLVSSYSDYSKNIATSDAAQNYFK